MTAPTTSRLTVASLDFIHIGADHGSVLGPRLELEIALQESSRLLLFVGFQIQKAQHAIGLGWDIFSRRKWMRRWSGVIRQKFARLLAVLFLNLSAFATVNSHAGMTAFVGATVINGTGADPQPNAVVLVTGERIAAFVKLLKERDVVYVTTLVVKEGYREVLGQQVELTEFVLALISLPSARCARQLTGGPFFIEQLPNQRYRRALKRHSWIPVYRFNLRY